MLIKVKDLSYIYDVKGVKTHALSGIDLELPINEFVAIQGKSGMGKSTLLKCLAGLLEPATGSILINNFELAGASDEELANYRSKTIGLMFQNYNLADYLSVIDNIKLPGIIAKTEEDYLNKRAEELLNSFDIIQYKDRYPDQLSGGEQQRVALCVALVNDPDIIFCDEPTGALDIENSHIIYKYLEELYQKRDKTVVVVTHDSMINEYASVKVKLTRNEALVV